MKDTSVPSQKKITAAEIGLHVSSTLRDLSVIFGKSILSSSRKMAYEESEGTLDLFSGTKNEQKITQNNVIELEIITLST